MATKRSYKIKTGKRKTVKRVPIKGAWQNCIKSTSKKYPKLHGKYLFQKASQHYNKKTQKCKVGYHRKHSTRELFAKLPFNNA